MEYYSTIKKEILPFVMTWVKLKGIILSEISQTEKSKYHIISLICEIQKKRNIIKTESRLVVARGGRR